MSMLGFTIAVVEDLKALWSFAASDKSFSPHFRIGVLIHVDSAE
jgi:hypothetical protein